MADNKSLMHNVRFTPAELEALRGVATERSCSVGAVVRWAVKTAVLEEPPSRQRGMNKGRAEVVETGGTALQNLV